MENSPFSPWWYYEMGKASSKSPRQPQQDPAQKTTQKSTIKQPTRSSNLSLGLGLFGIIMLWAFFAAIFSILIYIIASIFGGWSFWLCAVIGGIISIWFCSLFIR